MEVERWFWELVVGLSRCEMEATLTIAAGVLAVADSDKEIVAPSEAEKPASAAK